ncbi:MAG: hypothetical protein K1Y36_23190 [Blastocatellia bacterium]|nr:hypothetical protein [Blastocatellia bacterium]
MKVKLALASILLILAVALLLPSTAFLKSPDSGNSTFGSRTLVVQERVAAERQAFGDDSIFQKLSGPKRAILEKKFGKKKPPGGKPEPLPNPVPASLIATAQATARSETALNPPSKTALSNGLVNNPLADTNPVQGFTQNDTAIVVAGGNVVSAFLDTGSNNISPEKFTGFALSGNGGASFTDQGTLPSNGTDGDGGGPVLARSASTGTVLLSTLSFTTGWKLFAFRSTDNGTTFGSPAVNLAPGFDEFTGLQDKQWIACDNGSGAGGGNFYALWRNFSTPGGITFTRSTDDGLSWGPAGGTVLAGGRGQGAQVAVGADHAVYCLWFDDTNRQQRLRKSVNQGVSFGPEITVANVTSPGTNGDLSLAGGFRSNTFAQLAASPTNPNLLFCVFPDVGVTATDPADIFLVQSTDGGQTWSPRQKLNDDTTPTEQWQPALAVTPDGTRLIVSWYDRRLGGVGNTPIDYFATIGTISGSGATFEPNFRVTTAPFPAVAGIDFLVNANYMSDYDMAAADNSFFYLQWGDNRIPVLTATNQADCRFAKVPVAGPGPILAFKTRTVSGGNNNGFVEPNECNNLEVMISNVGTTSADNITATLTTSTFRVTVTQNTASFGSLTPGASGTNGTLFQISTAQQFSCGTTINFTLTLNYTGGSESIPFSIVTGSNNYQMSVQSIPFTPGTDLVPLSQDDDVVLPVMLPFPYTFYGQTFSTVQVCTNGTLQFSSNNNTFSNVCLPTSTLTDAIMPFWDDLDLRGPDTGIYTATSGIAPNRTFVIEWRGTLFQSLTLVDFEIRLYEGQTRFDCVYGPTHGGDGGFSTIGCQRSSGTAQTTFSCNQARISPGLGVGFLLPPCSPANGPCAGTNLTVTQFNPIASAPGKTIVIKGTNFTAAAQVFFGGTRLIPAAAVTFVDAQTLMVTVPPTSNGTGNINGFLTVRIGTTDATTQNLADASTPPCSPTATFAELVLLGDITGDGLLAQANDVALARAFTQFQAVPSVRQRLAADVVPISSGCRGDGALGATDIAFLRAVSFGQTQF